jgi:hypothetical protein
MRKWANGRWGRYIVEERERERERKDRIWLSHNGKQEYDFRDTTQCSLIQVKVKQSRYTPWRRLGGEEV